MELVLNVLDILEVGTAVVYNILEVGTAVGGFKI